MKGDTEDPTVQCFKVREIELISKSLKKNQRKETQKKILIDTLCENNINTVAEELFASENIDSYILMIFLLSMMNEVYHQPFPKKLSENFKLFKK